MAEMKVRKLKTQYRADVRHKKISKVKTLLLQQKRVKITKSVIFTRHGSHDQNRYLNPRLSPLKKLKIVENQRFFGRICASKTCSFIFSLKIGCDQNRYLNRFWPFYIFGRSVVRFRSPIHRHVFRLLAVFSLPPVWEDPGTSQQCIFFDAEDHICRDEHYFQLETDISRLPAGRSRGSLMIPFPGHGLRQSCCGSVVRPKVNRSL